jgi:hypothetical protein
MDHLRDCRRGEAEELREARRYDVAVLIAKRVNGLEILLDGGCVADC